MLFRKRKISRLQKSITSVFEQLESRQLMAVNTSTSQMVFNDMTSSGASAAQTIKITNTGSSSISLTSDGLMITGVNASRFAITSKPSLPSSIAPGASVNVLVNFTASTVGTIQLANLQIKTNDASNPMVNVALRGLGTSGQGGANEPSLQKILDLYNMPINVGDSNPDDVYLGTPVDPNDEILMSTLLKSGSGPVTIEALASFGVGSSSYYTTRFGYYTPGSKFDRTELFKVSGTGAATQTVNPAVNGVTSFDPGSKAFGLYGVWPSMQTINSSLVGGSQVYSEDRLNQDFDSASPRKVRFYQLKTSTGAVVPDAYVFAFEEFMGGYDNQDFVGIIRNVKAAPTGAEIGFENSNTLPFPDRLVFNRIQIQPPRPVTDPLTGIVTQPPNNIVHDLETLIVRNSGTSTLNVSSMSITAGWTIENTPSSFSIAPGGSQAVKIRFTATSGGLKTGTLTLNSNDSDEAAANIQLAGFWEKWSEEVEPKLAQLVSALGYQSVIAKSGQLLNHGGLVEAVGDEVLSGMWKRADALTNVTVRQLGAFHTQGNPATLIYYTVNSAGTLQKNTLFSHENLEGQSFFPHADDSTAWAENSFNTASTFGFRIDTEYTEDSRNVQEQEGGNYGHHVRFWPAKNRDGDVIPNTYIMAMDYQGINYDYNDNLYLVTNIKSANAPSTPQNLLAIVGGANIKLDWGANTDGNIAGYNVYRATTAGGTFIQIAGGLGNTDFTDTGAPAGTITYYHVTAVDTSGNESVYAAISATRSGTPDTTAPSAPSGMTIVPSLSGISLDWANNGEIDLAGYNVYRSSSASGTFTKLNSSLLGSSNYFDSSAAVGVASYYRITAVDTSGNESSATTTNAVRPSPDTTPPAIPTGAASTTSSAGIALHWAANLEADLDGYNIYRSDSLAGTYTKLNTALLTAGDFLDATAAVNVLSYYKITAVDKTGNESAGMTYSAFGPDTIAPTAPNGLTAVHGSTAIVLDWSDNAESDILGYRIYKSDSATGEFFLKKGLVTASTFSDTAATVNATSYYRITAIDKAGNESAFASVDHYRPYYYRSTNLGGTLAGKTAIVTPTRAYDVSGSGDVGGKSDTARYVHRFVTGDFDVMVRVSAMSMANGAEKAGLMVRETLDANSKMVFAFTHSGNKGYRMSYRTETGAEAIGVGTGAASLPNAWLRLRRVGNVFTSYKSNDGVNWTKLGSVTMNMTPTLYFGMAVSSASSTTLAKASFKNLV